MAEFYTSAARIVEKVLKKQGSPKSLVLNNENIKNKKKLYALVCEALKFKSVTEKIMEETKLLSQEKQLKHPLALVLLYDFLFGKGLKFGGKLKVIMNRNKTSLNAALARLKVKAKVSTNEELLPKDVQIQKEIQIPRYVRINTLQMGAEDVISWFGNNGYKRYEDREKTANGFPMIFSQSSKSFAVDNHIPDVLVFPPKTDFHDHLLYREGKIILQDKASCFPAFVLNPPAGSCVIDACAAPGNKTSHLAAIMKNKGKIFAFDIDAKRIKTMERLLYQAGEQITEIRNENFLNSNPNNPMYKNVQFILVDPSCSGSGMINRMDYATREQDMKNAEENQRIDALAQFQVTVLSHALRFPQVQKVVYSTCSIHDKENEEVVRSVLEQFNENFQLSYALPTWPYRGHTLFAEAKNCVRASPQEGLTNGFFLALFTRKQTHKTKKTLENDHGEDMKVNNELGKMKIKRKRKYNKRTAVLNNTKVIKRPKKQVEVAVEQLLMKDRRGWLRRDRNKKLRQLRRL